MRYSVLLCLLACMPAAAQNVPNTSFVPLQRADGAREWRFVVQIKTCDEECIANLLAIKMAEAHWCANGYESVSRKTVAGNYLIEGRCL